MMGERSVFRNKDRPALFKMWEHFCHNATRRHQGDALKHICCNTVTATHYCNTLTATHCNTIIWCIGITLIPLGAGLFCKKSLVFVSSFHNCTHLHTTCTHTSTYAQAERERDYRDTLAFIRAVEDDIWVYANIHVCIYIYMYIYIHMHT